MLHRFPSHQDAVQQGRKIRLKYIEDNIGKYIQMYDFINGRTDMDLPEEVVDILKKKISGLVSEWVHLQKQQ